MIENHHDFFNNPRLCGSPLSRRAAFQIFCSQNKYAKLYTIFLITEGSFIKKKKKKGKILFKWETLSLDN